MSRKDVINSPRLTELKNKRKQYFVRKIYIYTFGTLACVILFTYLSRIDKLNIQSVEIVGNNVTDTTLVTKTINEEMAGHYLWIFPKTNIFFYPRTKIEAILHDKYKRLKDVDAGIKNNEILEVKVTEREPKYNWCGQSSPEDGGGKTCYFTDDSGYIFDEAPYFSGDVYFKFYGNIDHADTPAGNYFATSQFTKFITFKDILEKLGLKPASLYYEEDKGDITVFLTRNKNASSSPKIIIKNTADISKIAENLNAALSTEPLLSDFKKKYDSLLYIDLRFGNKVYYKFRP